MDVGPEINGIRYCLSMNLQCIDRRMRIYRRRGERFAGACVEELGRFGGGSVMVWGGISFYNRIHLIIVNSNLIEQRSCNEGLVPVVVPFFKDNRNVTIFQQDNARCQTLWIDMCANVSHRH